MLRWLGLPLLVLGFMVGSGCGGSSGAPPPRSTRVKMADFKFSQSTVNVSTGSAQLYLVNAGSAAHDMVVIDAGGKVVAKSELVQAGNSAPFKLDKLAAGTYMFYCDVPGHRESGMEGRLVVS